MTGKLHLGADATGGIIRRWSAASSDFFYYPIVLRHPRGDQQLPVAEFVTLKHDGSILTSCLLQFVWALREKLRGVHVDTFTCDFSWPLMHSILIVLNGMNIVIYIQFCYKIVTEECNANDIRQVTILGLGRSHTVKEICSWTEIRTPRPSARVARMWKVAICRIVLATTMSEARQALISLFGILLPTVVTARAREALAWLRSQLFDDEREMESIFLDEDDENDELSNFSDAHKTIKCSSPFWQWADGVLRRRIEAVASEEALLVDDDMPNPYINAALARRVVDTLCPYLPMISSIVAEPLRYANDIDNESQLQTFDNIPGWTEGATEAWMAIVKRDIHLRIRRSLPDFVEHQHRSLVGRIRLFRNSLGKCTNILINKHCKKIRNFFRNLIAYILVMSVTANFMFMGTKLVEAYF